MKNSIDSSYVNTTRVQPYIWTIGLYFLVVPLDAIKLFEGFSFMKVLVLLPIFFSMGRIKSQGLKLTYTSLTAVIYILLVAISIMYSVDGASSRDAAISIAMNAGVAIYLSCIKLEDYEIDFLKKMLLVSCWFAAVLMFVSSIHNVSATGRVSIVSASGSQDSNYVCGYLLYAVAFYCEGLTQKENRVRSIVSLMLFVLLTFMTGSRGGLLALFFTILSSMFIIHFQRRKRQQIIIPIILLAIAILLFSPWIMKLLPHTVAERLSIQAVLTDGGTGRITLWNNIWEKFKTSTLPRQLFGYGIGTSFHFTVYGWLAHNTWLENLIGIGVIGTAVIFIFYCRLLIITWKRNEATIFGTLMGYLMMMMSLSIMGFKPIWNITLIILLLERLTNDE